MTEKENKSSHGVSRREFLRDAGLLIGGTAIGSTVLLAACGGDSEIVTDTVTKTVTNNVTTTVGEGATTVTTTIPSPTVTVTAQTEAGEVAEAIVKLNINGNDMSVMVRPNWTLQHVLHSKLGLTGTKEWCDAGACGACTVVMDGKPVLSCMMLAIECTGKKIETVEGIATSNHPIVEAYKNNHCMQCGYCTPGFVCTSKALLDKNPNPSKEEILDALSGNLCRCSTYPQHPIAIQEAAAIIGGGA